MNAIEIKNLCKNYNEFSLDHINFNLPAGCIMGLVGENGAGKSTTIKLLLNIVKRNAGTITILGKDNQKDFSLTLEDIGVVLDEPGIPAYMTPKDADLVMKNIFKNWESEIFFDYIKKFDLPPKKKFSDLSRGMKMKFSIAIALSHNAKLLILDEATSGLDPIVRDEILDIFNDFTRDENHSILLSSHIVSDLEKICDYITFIHKGKILFSEEKDLLLAKYGFYHGEQSALNSLPKEAVIGTKTSRYGGDALVNRELIHPNLPLDKASIEDIILFIVRGEKL